MQQIDQKSTTTAGVARARIFVTNNYFFIFRAMSDIWKFPAHDVVQSFHTIVHSAAILKSIWEKHSEEVDSLPRSIRVWNLRSENF